MLDKDSIRKHNMIPIENPVSILNRPLLSTVWYGLTGSESNPKTHLAPTLNLPYLKL